MHYTEIHLYALAPFSTFLYATPVLAMGEGDIYRKRAGIVGLLAISLGESYSSCLRHTPWWCVEVLRIAFLYYEWNIYSLALTWRPVLSNQDTGKDSTSMRLASMFSSDT